MVITIQDAIEALLEQYQDFSTGKSMDYTYGFLDALGVLRGMLNREKAK